MPEDLTTIASLADAALSFALLAGLVLMLVRGTLVSKTTHERVITDYEKRLVEKDDQCASRLSDKDSYCASMQELNGHQLMVVREEGDQRVDSLTEIMREREKRYAAVIGALEASANLESDIATIVRTFKMVGATDD